METLSARRATWPRKKWDSSIGNGKRAARSKHGDTLVGTLRKTYGPGFAKDRRADLMLNNLLKDAKCESLSEYLKKGK